MELTTHAAMHIEGGAEEAARGREEVRRADDTAADAFRVVVENGLGLVRFDPQIEVLSDRAEGGVICDVDALFEEKVAKRKLTCSPSPKPCL